MWCITQELFKEKHYADLDGGILEGFGRLLKYDLKLYVYPTLDEKTGQLVTAETLQVTADLLIVCNACYSLHSVCKQVNMQARQAAPGWDVVMQHTMMRLAILHVASLVVHRLSAIVSHSCIPRDHRAIMTACNHHSLHTMTAILIICDHSHALHSCD
jgi:hypothetical protein